MTKLNDIQKAKLCIEGRVGLTTIANVYAGRPVRSMQRQLVEEAAKKLGLPAPPVAALLAVSKPALSTAARLTLRLRPRGGALLSSAETETADPRQGRPRRQPMSQSKVSQAALMGNPGVHVTYVTTKPLLSELDLIAEGVSKTTAKQTIQAAGGAPVGNRWFITVEKFREYLDRQSKAATPASKAAKKPPAPKMTAREVAEAAGLRVVGSGK